MNCKAFFRSIQLDQFILKKYVWPRNIRINSANTIERKKDFLYKYPTKSIVQHQLSSDNSNKYNLNSRNSINQHETRINFDRSLRFGCKFDRRFENFVIYLRLINLIFLFKGIFNCSPRTTTGTWARTWTWSNGWSSSRTSGRSTALTTLTSQLSFLW